ncbi:hypothetical protein ACFWIA_00560 [Streptomyces sp. NPDC127068]
MTIRSRRGAVPPLDVWVRAAASGASSRRLLSMIVSLKMSSCSKENASFA